MAKRKSIKPLVLTIGEAGCTDGYALQGAHTLEEAKIAVKEYDGWPFDGAWPRHTLVEVTLAYLHCFGCGKEHGLKHERHCDCDEDGYVWNFRTGKPHTVLMRDGRSFHDHYPERVSS